MSNLKIFSDAQFEGHALHLLQQGTASHDLIFPEQKGVSVLSIAPPDPAMEQADIAVGQPSVDSVLNAKRLRWLQVTSAGFTRYDTAEFRAAAKERGLIVTNSSAVYEEACAEHVFSFMLAQARQLPVGLANRFPNGSADWNALRHASRCLVGEKVVVLGFGAIAARLIEILSPFKMEVIAMRRQPRGDEGIPIVTEENLAPALAEADHVINILPDNPASVGFISKERLAQFKPGAILYNIGRGTTVVQDALAESLTSGHLAAAWLDVTDPEPLPEGHPLLSIPTCHITPHTAGGHRNESETQVRHFLDNLERFTNGKPLRNRVI